MQDGQLPFQDKALAQELILDSDSDGHTSDDEDISHPHSNGDKGEDIIGTEYNPQIYRGSIIQ
jgi:hypothetical protein